MLEDVIGLHALSNDHGSIAIDPEPNTIKQALSLPDKKFWKKAVDNELKIKDEFDVLSEPMPLSEDKEALNQYWVFKRKRDAHGNTV